MSMRRNSITVNESGNIIMPENVSNIWMSEPELVELFGVIAPTLRSAIRNIYNSGALKEYEVQKYVRLYLRKEKTNIFFSLGINGWDMSNYQA